MFVALIYISCNSASINLVHNIKIPQWDIFGKNKIIRCL